jgi:hypothetical protein
MPSHRYDIDRFLEALITAERNKNAAPELRDWHLARAAALSTALGLEKGESASRAPIGADNMLNRAIAAAAEFGVHPFSGYLECPRELYELVQPYAASLSDLHGKLYKEWFAMARALLLCIHPHLADAATTSEQLQALGFDDSNEPDELDFF